VIAESKLKQNSLSVFSDANAQRIFWGQLISQTCDKLMSVGMIWVLSTHFSPKWIPWFIAVGALPHLLLASRSGNWINRWGALRTVIWADLFRGALFLICAWFIPHAGSDTYLLAFLLAATFISNVAGSLFNPAILSLPVAIMEPGNKRDKLTALIDSCFSFGNVLGPLAAALTYSAAGLGAMLIVNGLSYFFSALLAFGIRPQVSAHADTPAQDNSNGDSSASGSSSQRRRSVREVLRDQPVITGMLITFLMMNFFLGPLMIFMPWYAKNVYGDGISGLASLEACLGIGTVLGSTLLSVISLPGAIWKRISFCLSLMAIAYLSFTFSHILFLGCLCVGILGFFLALANVLTLNFFQSAPKSQDVPLVMGLVNLISVASLPISMGIAGSFIDNLQVQSFANICAAIVIAIAVSIRFIPGIQRV